MFDGQWGYLDHALGNPAILSRVTGVAEWHVNADEPSVLDYNDDFKSPGQVVSLYAADEFRVSDHDPVVVGLNLPVTFDSLCVLTKLFVDSTDVEQSLCTKLADAMAAAASGKTKTEQNILSAYVKQVEAQSGKSMTTAQAAKLIELAKQLNRRRGRVKMRKALLFLAMLALAAVAVPTGLATPGAKPPKPPKPPKVTTVKLLAFNDFHGHLEAGTPGTIRGCRRRHGALAVPAGGAEYFATHLKALGSDTASSEGARTRTSSARAT